MAVNVCIGVMGLGEGGSDISVCGPLLLGDLGEGLATLRAGSLGDVDRRHGPRPYDPPGLTRDRP